MEDVKTCCVAARVAAGIEGLGAVGLRREFGEMGDWEGVCLKYGLDGKGREWGEVECELEEIARMGGWTCCLGEEGFPEGLREVKDGAGWLSGVGEVDWGRPMVAVVGSRACTEQGREIAEMIAGRLVEAGVIVVSGMALGIDQAAHEAALAAGGQTVAVLGEGLGRVRQRAEQQLFSQIGQQGAYISQFGLGVMAAAHTFPIRNKVIAGLSQAVIVVEASERSGSLLTAEAARNYGRRALAVPGSVLAGRSRGVNRLIEGGAEVVVDVDGIVEKLFGLSVQPKSVDELDALSDEERVVYQLLKDGPLEMDELIRGSGLGVGKVAEVVLGLELRGRVRAFGELYRIV